MVVRSCDNLRKEIRGNKLSCCFRGTGRHSRPLSLEAVTPGDGDFEPGSGGAGQWIGIWLSPYHSPFLLSYRAATGAFAQALFLTEYIMYSSIEYGLHVQSTHKEENRGVAVATRSRTVKWQVPFLGARGTDWARSVPQWCGQEAFPRGVHI